MTTLRYELVSRNRYDTFEGAAAWTGSLGEWQCRLVDGVLEATGDGEPAALEARLRAWEASAFLAGQYDLRFLADVDGEDPASSIDDSQIWRRNSTSYPAPDAAFARTALVDELLDLIGRFQRGDLPLPSATFELLERLAAAAGPASGSIAEAYNIEPAVVERLHRLAERGHPAPPAGEPLPAYRGPEWQWMQEALRHLAVQAGRRTDHPPSARLAMSDFHATIG